MPKFLYWSAPSVIAFALCVFLNLSLFLVLLTFFIAYLGLFIELIRSIIIAKETPRNRKLQATRDYFR